MGWNTCWLTHLCRRPFAITTSVVATSGCCDEPAHCHQIYSPTIVSTIHAPAVLHPEECLLWQCVNEGKWPQIRKWFQFYRHCPCTTRRLLPCLPSAGRDAWGEGAAQRQNPLQLKTATTIGILMDARLVSRHGFYFTKSLVMGRTSLQHATTW